MNSAVIVAPREIHDLAYRASCVAGCDSGAAERIAHNVTFAEMQRGAAVSTFCDALAACDLPASPWVTAPDALAATEVAARSDGSAMVSFEPSVPLAAIAGTLQESLERGVASVGIDDSARGDTTIGSVEMRTIDEGAVAALRERMAEAHNHSHRAGIPLERTWFAQLEAAGRGYLVAEAALDEIDSRNDA